MMFHNRDTVMRIMRSIDPEDVEQRRMRKLKRRAYYSKVHAIPYTFNNDSQANALHVHLNVF